VSGRRRISFLMAAAIGTTMGCAAASGGVGTTDGIAVNNGSSISVLVSVNGRTVSSVDPHVAAVVTKQQLPAYPWDVSVTTSTGRVLLSLLVKTGDVGPGHGDGNRADLSCGRIDVWSGPPMNGPVPAPGAPGDCGP
jgi:hypothetical protein